MKKFIAMLLIAFSFSSVASTGFQVVVSDFDTTVWLMPAFDEHDSRTECEAHIDLIVEHNLIQDLVSAFCIEVEKGSVRSYAGV